MKAHRRYPMLVRSLASAAALTVAAQGGGVSMCVSLIAEATAPCAIHTHAASPGHDAHIATLSAAPSGHEACHADAASFGCAVGGTCPTGAAAVPAFAAPALTIASLGRAPVLAVGRGHTSFVAPPLPPPPQA
jgi:hypothetical protein